MFFGLNEQIYLCLVTSDNAKDSNRYYLIQLHTVLRDFNVL